jgi:hypothetical protein
VKAIKHHKYADGWLLSPSVYPNWLICKEFMGHSISPGRTYNKTFFLPKMLSFLREERRPHFVYIMAGNPEYRWGTAARAGSQSS